MMLLDDVDCMVDQSGVAKETAKNYRRSVRFYGEHLGRPAKRDDLVERAVNAWLADVADQRASSTVLGHKRSITAVWNWLADRNLVQRYDQRMLRAVKLTTPPPRSWSLEQLQQLLQGADALAGTLKGGLSASVLMRAWVIVGYETAFRPSDMRRLRPIDLNGNRISIVQHKTSRTHHTTLTPLAMEAIKPLLQLDCETLFPASRNTIRRWELRLYDAAKKFGFHRKRGQGIGTLRKTNATEVCRRDGIDAAARSLGHVSGTAIAKRFYVSPDAMSDTPTPPALIHAFQPSGIAEGSGHCNRAG